MSKYLSADGVELKAGMKAAHVDDEWNNAQDVLLVIPPGAKSKPCLIVCRDEYGQVSHYPPWCFATSAAGLLKAQIEDMKRRLVGMEQSILGLRKDIEEKTTALANLESTP